jgi:hypothetical protein
MLRASLGCFLMNPARSVSAGGLRCRRVWAWINAKYWPCLGVKVFPARLTSATGKLGDLAGFSSGIVLAMIVLLIGCGQGETCHTYARAGEKRGLGCGRRPTYRRGAGSGFWPTRELSSPATGRARTAINRHHRNPQSVRVQ